MHEPRRKPHRLPELFYHGRQIYFLTLCTHGRKKVFTDPELVPHLIEVLREKCQTQAYSVYAFCFMPDHMHVVVVGMDDSAALSRAIRAFKGASVARARALGVSSLWQKGFYDHVVRTGEGADRVAWYVFMNPVRAGLVSKIEEWPFSGSFMFDWRKLSAPTEPFVPPWKKSGSEEKRAG